MNECRLPVDVGQECPTYQLWLSIRSSNSLATDVDRPLTVNGRTVFAMLCESRTGMSEPLGEKERIAAE